MTFTDSPQFGVTKILEGAALSFKGRVGLAQLLHDVISGNAPFKAILVYDVSRWGRFQDPDEAAHYEFVCKAADAPVHYCAETFANDGNLPNTIMKALKRAMAGEDNCVRDKVKSLCYVCTTTPTTLSKSSA